jgi:hypothetical protein
MTINSQKLLQIVEKSNKFEHNNNIYEVSFPEYLENPISLPLILPI